MRMQMLTKCINSQFISVTLARLFEFAITFFLNYSFKNQLNYRHFSQGVINGTNISRLI